VAGLLTASWLALPRFWGTVTGALRPSTLREIGSIRGVATSLADLIAALYLETDASLDERAPCSEPAIPPAGRTR
jgi:hypothetical protein